MQISPTETILNAPWAIDAVSIGIGIIIIITTTVWG
jgi:hypothetical protein